MALKNMGELGLADVTKYYSSLWRRLLRRSTYEVYRFNTQSTYYYDNYKKIWTM